MAYIYKITNNINQKVYIGQTIMTPVQRWQKHRSDAKLNKPYPLYRAMNKYGIDNFSFEILEEVKVEELDEKERYYINLYHSYINFENSNGYNATLGGSKGNHYFNPCIDEVIECAQYMTINQLANHFGVGYATMKNYLHNYNIQPQKGRTGGGDKSIAQIDINTNEIIQIFPRIADASRFFGKIPKNSGIRDVLKGKRKTAYGYKWKYI